MISLFKRKDKEEKVLDDYVYECRKLLFPEELIIQRLREMNVPKEYIEKNFQLNILKEVINMPKEKKPEYEEEADDEAETTEEDEVDEADDSDEEVIEETPRKVVKQLKKVEAKPESKVTIEQVLSNFEQRLLKLESTLANLLYRLS